MIDTDARGRSDSEKCSRTYFTESSKHASIDLVGGRARMLQLLSCMGGTAKAPPRCDRLERTLPEVNNVGYRCQR